jgi:hypothetical protein
MDHSHTQFPNPFMLARKGEIIDDHILVAGILFEHKSRLHKRLITRESDHPKIVMEGGHTLLEIPVHPEAVSQLHEVHALCGSPNAYHTERTRLKLSANGNRLVVTKWYQECCGIEDILVAADAINLRTGEITWSSG